MQYAAFILIVLVQGIRCQKNCTARTNDKKDFCVTSCNSSQSNCSGNSVCVCDGDCGYSCVSRDLRCPRPGNIANGRVRYKQDTFGSIARYRCFEPYQLVGSKKRICRGKGVWDGTKPVCKVICQDPGNIQHGTKHHGGFESGKKVKYRCSPGFTLKGKGTLTCIRTGQWDRQKPSCTCVRTNKKTYRYCQTACDPKRNTCRGNKECVCDGDCGYSCVPRGLTCGRPSQIQNGRRQGSSARFLSSVKYQCNKPYELIGSSVRTCRGIKEWDGEPPQCKILCQDPGEIDFGNKQVFSNEERDYLTVGDRVRYNCFPSYNMEGFELLICDESGRWNNPKPRCILPSCGPPPIPANAELVKPRKSFRFNDKVMFRCKSGHFATGILLQTCGAQGWSSLASRCPPKSCGDPGSPANGKIKSYTFTFKSKVYFECNYGYRLVGGEYRQCQANQKWSGRMPSCELIDCGELPTPEKAEKVMQTHTRVDGVVRFRCKERGYEIIGSETRDCLETGLWSGFPTSCKIISCGDPGTPLNGKQVSVKNNFNFGGSVEFACNDNYTLTGRHVIQCEETKDWNAPIPKCFAPCSDPGVPANGSRTRDDFRHGRSVSFTCQQGYELEGDKTITCWEGRWSGERPQCEVISCGDPGTPLNGRQKRTKSFTYGGFVRFKCDKDYTLKGKSKLRCEANKKWNGELPQCLAPCPNPGQLLNGRIIGDNFTHDSLVKFECMSGFSLKGSPAMRCNNGAWNTTKPTCTDCNGGKPLGMQSGAIPDSSITASSQNYQHPAHHGRLGKNRFWCSESERRSYIQIHLPQKYKITAVSIEVKDSSKVGIGLSVLFYNHWLGFHAERPRSRSGKERIVLAQPVIAETIQIRLSQPRKVRSSVCLRAEVYGCEIPRDCIMPGSTVLGLVGGRYWEGKLVRGFEFVYISGFRNLGKTDFVPDEIPSSGELSKDISVLVKDANSDLIREGKIAQTRGPLYSVQTKDGVVNYVNVKDIRVVKEPKFCPP